MLSGQSFPLCWTDPGSDAQRRHLGCPYGSGLSKGSLKTFLEDAEYVPLQRFKVGHWGLLVALEKLCSECFHPAGFLLEGI